MKEVRFLDLDCVELANESLALLVTRSVGPRVLALRLHGGRNLLAELPDKLLQWPGQPDYSLYGGHRLWYAPEVPAVTYQPDDDPVQINPLVDGLEAIQPAEARYGVQKTLRFRLVDDRARVIVEHGLENTGRAPVMCAPWAITVMRTGGTAILPQNQELADRDGVQPNRALVLWPYTDLSRAGIHPGRDYVRVHVPQITEPFKVGFANRRGWLAYHLDELLFVKFAAYQPAGAYLDQGASSQCYAARDFLELETLGPVVRLQPGESVWHRELWTVIPGVAAEAVEARLPELVAQLALDEAPPELV